MAYSYDLLIKKHANVKCMILSTIYFNKCYFQNKSHVIDNAVNIGYN